MNALSASSQGVFSSPGLFALGSLVCLLSVFLVVLWRELQTREAELRDVRRRAAEGAATAHRFELAMNAVNDGVWDWDMVNHTVYFSPRWFSMLGYADGELPSSFETWKDLLHPDDEGPSTRAMERFIRTRQPRFHIEFRMRTAAGGYRWILARGRAVSFAEDGSIARFIGAHTDITPLKQSEQALMESREMDAIGRLAGGIAHDFNNLLGGIMGFAELLSMRLQENDRLKTYADYIITNTERASELTSQLLAFSRKAPLAARPDDLHSCLADAVAILRHTLGPQTEIIFTRGAGRSVVHCDASRLQNVFLNMGINAREAMPSGGQLEYRTENEIVRDDHPLVQKKGLSPGLYLVIHVKDTGKGIEPDLVGRIFEPFFTTKDIRSGAGLGLSAVYGTIISHEGDITVDSLPDEGTVFHIYLPVCPEAAVSVPTDQAVPQPHATTGLVLMVDPDDSTLDTTIGILMEIGFQTVSTGLGKEGIDLFNRRRNALRAVILKRRLPDMDGQEVFEHIREAAPEIPVLLICDSPDARAPDPHTGILPTPFHYQDLARSLAEVMSGGKYS